MGSYTVVFEDRRKKNRLILAKNKLEAIKEAKNKYKCGFVVYCNWFAKGRGGLND